MSFDIEAHTGHLAHKAGHKWLDITVALSAVFISLVSLGVAILHGHTMEAMADANARLVAANSWPFLAYGSGIVTVNGVTRAQMRVYNSGVGPAKIESAELVWKGVAYRKSRDFLAACCEFDTENFDSSLLSNVVLPPGQAVEFIGLAQTTDAKAFAALHAAMFSRDLQLNICYCSIFDDCWRTDVTKLSLKPEPVKACVAPKVPFDEGLVG